MRVFIGAVMAAVVFLVMVGTVLSQVSMSDHTRIYQSSFKATWGTGKTADTTVVSGGTATDKYFISPTSKPNGKLWIEAKAETLIIHSSVSDTGIVIDVLRVK